MILITDDRFPNKYNCRKVVPRADGAVLEKIEKIVPGIFVTLLFYITGGISKQK